MNKISGIFILLLLVLSCKEPSMFPLQIENSWRSQILIQEDQSLICILDRKDTAEGTLLYKVNPLTGENISQSFDEDYQVEQALLFQDSLYLFDGNSIRSLHTKTLETHWNREMPHFVIQSMVAQEDVLYVAVNDFMQSYLYTLNRDTGELLSENSDVFEINQLAVEDGQLFYGSLDGKLYSYLLEENQHRWSFEVGEQIHSIPLISDEHVLFTANDHHLYCLDRDSGELIWKREHYNPTGEIGVSQNGILYTISSSHEIAAIEMATGNEIWNETIEGGSIHEMIDWDESTLVLGSFSEILWLNKQDASMVKRKNLPRNAVLNNGIYGHRIATSEVSVYFISSQLQSEGDISYISVLHQ